MEGERERGKERQSVIPNIFKFFIETIFIPFSSSKVAFYGIEEIKELWLLVD